jgi:enterochelin esterase-like enzyme
MKSFFYFVLFFIPILYAQQSHVNLDFNPQKNTEGLIPFMADQVSPEVMDDHTVIFRLKAPEANGVLLSGYSLLAALKADAPLPFNKDTAGVWSLKTAPVEPGIYVYKLIIDGIEVCDPNNTFTGGGNQPGYSLLIIHGNEPAYYDAKNVPHGAVTRNIYHSEVTNGEREIYVYTPPGYNKDKKYPVIYLMGGSGEVAANWTIEGRINFIMDNLLAEGKAVPMVIAIFNNQVVHRNSPGHTEISYKTTGEELRKVVIPFVEANYSVRDDRNGRALAGLSMGGRHTQFVGFNSLDLFASFGILSAGDVNSETESTAFLNDPEVNSKVDYLFVGAGTLEFKPDDRTDMLHKALLNHNIKHDFYVGGSGAHDWNTWRHLMYEKFLPGLWKKL